MTSVFQANITRPVATASIPYQHSYTAAAQLPRPTVTDDYERWYTENTPSNRMLMSLRSGIDSEISWALDRLCRLCNNEQFILAAIPGLTEALFVWPDWYVSTGAEECATKASLFALPKALERQRRHALESMFILKNSAVNDTNSTELAGHNRTRTLILLALHRLQPETDANTEFLTYVIELLQSISTTLILPPPDSPLLANPVPPLEALAATATDRTLILTALRTLTLQMANPANIAHLKPETPALFAALRYLPLLSDKQLVEACLNYIYTHLSHPPMTRAFLPAFRISGNSEIVGGYHFVRASRGDGLCSPLRTCAHCPCACGDESGLSNATGRARETYTNTGATALLRMDETYL
ncbi:hypothetical protein QCA50_002475 [Cerrena zonata]|uniref:Uncharacterized protein n=1 Tax=Cerrena zonata TaxID=2478898 RepID=A0AAW0GVH2_9APHY